MPGFKAAWDAAKRKFETESGQKKAKTPFFFGLFSAQGSGIGAALDKLEKTKTKKDWDAAWKAYQTKIKAFAAAASTELDAAKAKKDATKKKAETEDNVEIFDDTKLKRAYSNLWETVKDIEADAKTAKEKLK